MNIYKKKIFFKKKSLVYEFRVLIIILIIIFLSYFNYKFNFLKKFDNNIFLLKSSLGCFYNNKVKYINNIFEKLETKNIILKKNERLILKILSMKAVEQRLLFLEHENNELKKLLNYTKNQALKKFIFAEIIGNYSNVFTQEIIINKGSNNGIHIGQLGLDSYGIIGQVVLVMPNYSKIMLITNKKSAIPVIIVRNGLNAVALGTGFCDSLLLANVPETADILINDIIVTSHIGQIIPAGFCIGIVKKIQKTNSEGFLKITIIPTANINKSRYIALI